MSVTPTRTLNPLHFEDLEPHRFEDLVRQLAYDFKNWKAIEATGRLGKDEGIDIRGIEVVDTGEDLDEGDEEAIKNQAVERIWNFQCKREKEIGPKKLGQIIAASIPDDRDAPYGFVLAAACDFSKESRDRFRVDLRQRGVQEYLLWGRADLEDMLFLPKNDHLLFAYFNISIQVRRRNRRSLIRSRLATKKSLLKLFGNGINPRNLFDSVLVRDVDAETPLHAWQIKGLIDARQWVYANCIGHIVPDHLGFIVRRHRGYLSDDHTTWDAMLGVRDTQAARSLLGRLAREALASDFSDEGGYDYYAQVPERNRIWYNVITLLHYDRIIAVDGDGDVWNQGPQVIVDLDPQSGVFERTFWKTLTRELTGDAICYPKPVSRIEYFPAELRETRHRKVDAMDDSTSSDNLESGVD